MSRFRVSEKCNGCLGCVQNCPARALEYRDEGGQRTILHNVARCARCATCYRVCPQRAVEFKHLLEGGWDEVVTLAMVRCSVCGELIHSDRLQGGIDAKLRDFVGTLCPRHRAKAAGQTRRNDAAGERGEIP